MLLTILTSQSVLLAAILVHELGHYLAARALGVQAENFTIGIGPTFTLFSTKGTKFRLSPLLIGGYVQYDQESFDNAPAYKRLLIVCAGPAAGIIAAIVPLWLLGVLYFNCSALQSLQASLHAIAAIAGHIVSSTVDLFAGIGHWLGVSAPPAAKVTIADAGRFSDNYTFMKTASGQVYLTYLAGVSIALSVINLFPIPPLDGGKLVLYAVELVTRRKLPLIAQLVPALFGVALLLFGFFASLWNDAVALF